MADFEKAFDSLEWSSVFSLVFHTADKRNFQTGKEIIFYKIFFVGLLP